MVKRTYPLSAELGDVDAAKAINATHMARKAEAIFIGTPENIKSIWLNSQNTFLDLKAESNSYEYAL
ncbi:MAG: hypothetical protein ACK5KM_03625 [Hyphomicrobiaceae bacterium]